MQATQTGKRMLQQIEERGINRRPVSRKIRRRSVGHDHCDCDVHAGNEGCVGGRKKTPDDEGGVHAGACDEGICGVEDGQGFGVSFLSVVREGLTQDYQRE